MTNSDDDIPAAAAAAPTTADLMLLLRQMAADNQKERDERQQREAALQQTLADQQKKMDDLQAAIARCQIQQPQIAPALHSIQAAMPAQPGVGPPVQAPLGTGPLVPHSAAPAPNLPAAFPVPPPGFIPNSQASFPPPASNPPPGSNNALPNPPPSSGPNQVTGLGTSTSAAGSSAGMPPAPSPSTFTPVFSDTGSLLRPSYIVSAGLGGPAPTQTVGSGVLGLALGHNTQSLPTNVAALGNPIAPLANVASDAQSQHSDSSRGSRGRGRGPRQRRDRAPTRRPAREEETGDEYDSEEDTGDEGDGYERNRERKERPGASVKHLNLEKFSCSNKAQDFPVWVRQYQDSIRRNFNPHSKRRHFLYCLEWFPALLDTEAYAIWEKAENRDKDWEKLKDELELTYEDPAMRTEWKNNLKAYVWDEHNVSLQTYSAKVKRYVDTFETDMSDCPKALRGQYYLRFFNGLPEDYQGQVTLSLTAKNQDIDKAMEVCLRFQSFKKNKGKKEEAAGVTFQEATVPARVASNEAELARVKNQLRKMEQKQSTQSTTPDSPATVPPNQYAGHSPFYPNGRYNQQKDQDRMKRFLANRRMRGGRGNFQRRRYDNTQTQQSQSSTPSTPTPQQPAVTEQHASVEEGLGLQTDVESDEEWADETLGLYGQFLLEEQLAGLAEFGRIKDASKGN